MLGVTHANSKITVKSSLGEYVDTVQNYYRRSLIFQYLIEHNIFQKPDNMSFINKVA